MRVQETDVGPGRPAADECLSYYVQYIELVPEGHVGKLLERQIAESAAFLTSFTPAQARWREAPGEWNILEIVGHLADTERVFGYRALRIARADPVVWTPVEFGDWAAAANFQARSLGDVVAEYAAVRAGFVAFLSGLDAAAWERRAPSDWTLRSVRAIAYVMAGHELHHLESIRRQHNR
jgi:DinB superfamily